MSAKGRPVTADVIRGSPRSGVNVQAGPRGVLLSSTRLQDRPGGAAGAPSVASSSGGKGEGVVARTRCSPLTVSIGIAITPLHCPPDRLVRTADAALLRAKAMGRDRVEIAQQRDAFAAT